ncbi:MAG: hypothetical protein EP330_10965 [Deltaproteobacteria bacterium]|nr:MAG: hypothetical protein EP330_10965 [Deltaproteobacteria bacterium]
MLARPVVWVLGPSGSGRTSVATRLAGGEHLALDGRALQAALAHQVKRKRWADELVHTDALVLDGPSWLRGRPGVVAALSDLLAQRLQGRRRTVVVQSDEDPSLDVVLGAVEPEDVAVVGLRFPAGERGRRRAVRRLCAELGLGMQAGRGLAGIDPWTYAEVRRRLTSSE